MAWAQPYDDHTLMVIDIFIHTHTTYACTNTRTHTHIANKKYWRTTFGIFDVVLKLWTLNEPKVTVPCTIPIASMYTMCVRCACVCDEEVKQQQRISNSQPLAFGHLFEFIEVEINSNECVAFRAGWFISVHCWATMLETSQIKSTENSSCFSFAVCCISICMHLKDSRENKCITMSSNNKIIGKLSLAFSCALQTDWFPQDEKDNYWGMDRKRRRTWKAGKSHI